MSDPGAWRRLLAIVLIAAGLAAGAWAVAIHLTGGIDTRVLGRTISSHNPIKPALVAWLAAFGAAAAAGFGSSRAAIRARAARANPSMVAIGLAGVSFAAGLRGGAAAAAAGALLTWLTFLTGRTIASSWAGLAGAALVAASPTVRYAASALPFETAAAVAWLGTCVVLFTTPVTTRRAATAGTIAGAAILAEPTLSPLAIVLIIWLAASGRQGPALAFSGITLQFAIVALAMNFSRTGAALTFARGPLDHIFSTSVAASNAATYAGWFVTSHTIVPIAGLLAYFAPPGRFWPAAADRPRIVTCGVLVVVVLAHGLLSTAWPTWEGLTSFLPALPWLFIGVAAWATTIVRGGSPAIGLAVIWLFGTLASVLAFADMHGY